MEIQDGIAEIWATIDPKHDLQEVYNYFVEQNRNFFVPHLSADDIKHNVNQECYVVDPLKVDLNKPSVKAEFKGGIQNLESYFALPYPGDNGAVTDFVDVHWPKDSSAVKNTFFRHRTPSLHLSFVRNIEYKDPYAFITLYFSSGALGMRSPSLSALLQVLKDDLNFNGLSSNIEGLYNELLPISKRVGEFEKQHRVFFEDMASQIRERSIQCIKNFAGSSRFLIEKNVLSGPVDLTTGNSTDKLLQWRIQGHDELQLKYWARRISWEGYEQERAIKFLISKKQDDSFCDQLVKACVSVGKGCWPELIHILSEKPVSYECQQHMISFMADPNWPGAGEAFVFIQNNRELFRDALNESLLLAQESHDGSWTEMIREVLGLESEE